VAAAAATTLYVPRLHPHALRLQHHASRLQHTCTRAYAATHVPHASRWPTRCF
jgi:branched-subunit amino acid aminotransferase/4-amino-4-deoxychorismate lyase